jgi:hypothetical protein
MDACGLRFRRPGPPISCPGRPICSQSQICAEAHVLGDTRTPVASGLSAGRPFPAFTSVAALLSRRQGLDCFCQRSTRNVVALHRTLNANGTVDRSTLQQPAKILFRYHEAVGVALIGLFVPAADQRVPHIWPSFGQMWETRTSTLNSSARSAKAFEGPH